MSKDEELGGSVSGFARTGAIELHQHSSAWPAAGESQATRTRNLGFPERYLELTNGAVA